MERGVRERRGEEKEKIGIGIGIDISIGVSVGMDGFGFDYVLRHHAYRQGKAGARRKGTVRQGHGHTYTGGFFTCVI